MGVVSWSFGGAGGSPLPPSWLLLMGLSPPAGVWCMCVWVVVSCACGIGGGGVRLLAHGCPVQPGQTAKYGGEVDRNMGRNMDGLVLLTQVLVGLVLWHAGAPSFLAPPAGGREGSVGPPR